LKVKIRGMKLYILKLCKVDTITTIKYPLKTLDIGNVCVFRKSVE